MDFKTQKWMEIYQKLAEQLKDVYRGRLREVILYGSVARGTADEDSDIDILVLVDATQEQLKDYSRQLSEVSTDFALEYLKVFSIVDVSYGEYKEWKDVLPFYKNISDEGIVLYAA